MKILLIGDNGQLAKYKKKIKKKKYTIYSASKYNFSSNNYKQNNQLLKKLKIDLIINTKAYTDVEKAEKEKSLAYKLNTSLVKKISILCKINNIILIHISTDFVFNGKSSKPYSEKSKTFPINYYGQTKLLGEEYIKKNMVKYIIIRTSKIYSEEGNNFLIKMINNSMREKNLKYLKDEFFCPTYAKDLAKFIFLLISNIKKIEFSKIINFTGDKKFTPYKLIRLILKTLKKMNFKDYAKLKVANVKDLNLLAKRPKFSILDNKTANTLLNFKRTPIKKIINLILMKEKNAKFR